LAFVHYVRDAASLVEFGKQHLSLKAPTTYESRASKIQLSQRVFHLVTNVDRSKKSDADAIPGTQSLHCVYFPGAADLVVHTRELSCFCPACKVHQYDACDNKAYVDAPQFVAMQPKGASVSIVENCFTRGACDDGEEDIDIADMVQATTSRVPHMHRASDFECVFVVPVEDHPPYTFFMARCTTPVHILQKKSTDEYGQVFQRGFKVLEGQYFELLDESETANQAEGVYRLNPKKALFHAHHVCYTGITLQTQRRKYKNKDTGKFEECDMYKLSHDDFEAIMQSVSKAVF
jgi:hypothetical protein